MAKAWQSLGSSSCARGSSILVFIPTLECGVLASERGGRSPHQHITKLVAQGKRSAQPSNIVSMKLVRGLCAAVSRFLEEFTAWNAVFTCAVVLPADEDEESHAHKQSYRMRAQHRGFKRVIYSQSPRLKR